MAYCIEESFLLFIKTQGEALKDVSEYIRTKNTASGFFKKGSSVKPVGMLRRFFLLIS